MKDELAVFSHVRAENVALYRAILRIFTDAKAAFALHLRPADIRMALIDHSAFDSSDAGGVEAALAQLCEWGNLEAHRDTADVATVEEFYRPRFLYQLTAGGEAAERALAVFYETLEQPGELQTAALEDILRYLGELEKISEDPLADEGVVHHALILLSARFEQLTFRAQTFIRDLQRRIDLRRIEVSAFLSYKQTLIDHIERFIGELIVATYEIAQRIHNIEKSDVSRLLEIAAKRESVDAIEPTRAERFAVGTELWRARWAGLRSWFISEASKPSQAEVLRSRARSAIPALLSGVAGINERRFTRSDRAADLQTLAKWFAETDTDADAHRLWRAAFALSPARHLHIDQDAMDRRDETPIPAHVSWLIAEPLRISPRVRRSGRHVAKGPPRRVIDRSQEKEYLAQVARDEAFQIAAAQQRLATGKQMRLSAIGTLDPTAFDLFLDLLGEALAYKLHATASVVAYSSDGALRIELSPTDDERSAVITTSSGVFVGEDHHITITDVFAGASQAA
ncbi:MAG: hypothetical protein QOF24_2316 [Verrucomicrobiota bacterium]|jgi:uncharacterized protein (TIGR02677 family)